jgi:hypothetical protein
MRIIVPIEIGTTWAADTAGRGRLGHQFLTE